MLANNNKQFFPSQSENFQSEDPKFGAFLGLGLRFTKMHKIENLF